jgi:hypothetical protein
VPVRTSEDLDGAFAMMARERVNGCLFVASPLSRAQRTLLAELSLKYRLAGMFGIRETRAICRSFRTPRRSLT